MSYDDPAAAIVKVAVNVVDDTAAAILYLKA